MNASEKYLFGAKCQIATDVVARVIVPIAQNDGLDVAISGTLSALAALVAMKVEQCRPDLFATPQERARYAEAVGKEIAMCFKSAGEKHGIPCNTIDIFYDVQGN